ncbi:hypothetical protein [Naasia sp. SYSU D00057]|uniref:hypothetical protein n=1 Tax=Naasia sp. SYSU D00057 TaxID=2817380 RepID=UPI001B30B1C8|nr:hypothetical protein [Naasia sp. SYSU D00057]
MPEMRKEDIEARLTELGRRREELLSMGFRLDPAFQAASLEELDAIQEEERQLLKRSGDS